MVTPKILQPKENLVKKKQKKKTVEEQGRISKFSVETNISFHGKNVWKEMVMQTR